MTLQDNQKSARFQRLPSIRKLIKIGESDDKYEQIAMDDSPQAQLHENHSHIALSDAWDENDDHLSSSVQPVQTGSAAHRFATRQTDAELFDVLPPVPPPAQEKSSYARFAGTGHNDAPSSSQSRRSSPSANFFGLRHTDAALPYVLPSSPTAVPKRIARRGKAILAHPAIKLALGLIVGVALLVYVATLVNLPRTLHVVQTQITTPRGFFCAFMASLVFLMAFFFRAMRWRLFLNPVGKVSVLRVVQLFMVGVFLNFLVPIRIGEVAKGLLVKRVSGIPVSQSFSTITMDKVFDLLPALFIIVLLPVLNLRLDGRFWLVLGVASAILFGMVLFILLSAWKRTLAVGILHNITKLLPGALGNKIEGFATGFVDAVLMSAKRPRIFLLAAGLTIIAVCFDGLYNLFSFWAIGYPITFGQAVFGYMVFNIFYVLPNPPGQVGSNEVVGLLIFHGLLHIPAENVLAMIGLFHLWSGILMCSTGMISLSSLGVTLSSTMKMKAVSEKAG